MRRYVAVLRHQGFRRLWLGATVSAVGDGMTFVALAPNQFLVGAGFFVIGLLSAPMTVWAQSLRMRRIPAELHGRAFATLRTLMQGTPPVGTLLVTPLLAADHLTVAALAMTLLAGLPALLVYSNPETSADWKRSQVRQPA